MKQMIWSSYDLLDETAKEEYQNSQREILDDDSYEVSDEEWAEEVYCRLDDERSNLNKEVDGIIVVFGNLGGIMERPETRLSNIGQHHCRYFEIPVRRCRMVRRRLQHSRTDGPS